MQSPPPLLHPIYASATPQAMVATGAALPLWAFVGRNTLGLSPTVVSSISGLGGAVLLGGMVGSPLGTEATMMNSVMAFMVSWRAVTDPLVRDPNEGIVSRVLSLLGDLFPTREVTPPPPSSSDNNGVASNSTSSIGAYLWKAGGISLRLAGKLLASYVLKNVALRGATAGVATPVLASIWTLMIAVLPSSETAELVVHLGSMGTYEVVSFNNWFLASSSLHEFWSRRYNRLISRFFHHTLYEPLRKDHGVSPPAAAMAVFTASGALHAYVAHLVFGRGELSSMAFFMLHGAAVCAERWADKNIPAFADRPAWLGRILTLAVFASTFSLYPGLFVSEWPGWFVRNPITAPPPLATLGDHLLPHVFTALRPLGF